MHTARRFGLGTLVLLGFLSVVTPLSRAHGAAGTGSGHDIAFGLVVGSTVALGFLGGAIVLRWRPSVGGGRQSMIAVALLLVILGGWAAVRAIDLNPALAISIVTAGAIAVWVLRNRVVGHHPVTGQAALGVVVLHRIVEGPLLATLYSADVGVGIVAALVIASHTAAETGAVAGLWAAGRWRWAVVSVIQLAFVAGTLGGAYATRLTGPLSTVTVLALFGGVMIAAGVAAASGPAPAATTF